MKTHALAEALEEFVRALKKGPNVEIGAFLNNAGRERETNKSESLAVNLSTLAELASVDKGEWLIFAQEFNIPISLRPRDASRDVLGKLLKYLEENPVARNEIRIKAIQKKQVASPALMKALGLLLSTEGAT